MPELKRVKVTAMPGTRPSQLATLRQVRKMVRDGETKTIVIGFLRHDGSYGGFYSGMSSKLERIGLYAILQRCELGE